MLITLPYEQPYLIIIS